MPAITTFASVDDLLARLGLDEWEGGEATRAATLLTQATGVIQDALKQHVFTVSGDTWTTRGTNDERLPLPERPVVSVASVTLNGRAISGWYLDGNVLVRRAFGTIEVIDGDFEHRRRRGGFGIPQWPLVVVYDHGFADDAIPPLLKTICMEAVVRVWVNPGSVARETVGDTATVYDNMRFSPNGMMLTDTELKQLRRKFGRTLSSLSIGG